jgi:hypothetical protein
VGCEEMPDAWAGMPCTRTRTKTERKRWPTILLKSLEDNDAGVHLEVVERAQFTFLNQGFELAQ